VSTVPEVLFVCVHNAGRSQMAAALLDHHAQGRVHVRSAGSTPASEINPAVREVMSELGLDLSGEFPKPLTTEVVEGADVVITMGCGEACPVFPGKRYLDWTLTDPAGKPVDEVRAIRDDIDVRVEGLLAELVRVPASRNHDPDHDVPAATASRGVRVELRSHQGCPLVERTRSLLRECLAEAGLSTPVIETVGAYPSPTVLVDGRDVMGDPGVAPGIAACRVDAPTRDRLLAALHTGSR
jgi:protein-tyrosine-phosphatase